MKNSLMILTILLAASFCGCAIRRPAGPAPMTKQEAESYFLPNAAASRVVSVASGGASAASVLVQTHAVSVKETGPREAVARFGEVYAFSPAFFAVHRDEPTLVRFWNLQPDDNHDFMLIDPHATVLMKVLLPPLKETSFVFTFHEEGLYTFARCISRP